VPQWHKYYTQFCQRLSTGIEVEMGDNKRAWRSKITYSYFPSMVLKVKKSKGKAIPVTGRGVP
jgi:hypothetical protein